MLYLFGIKNKVLYLLRFCPNFFKRLSRSVRIINQTLINYQATCMQVVFLVLLSVWSCLILLISSKTCLSMMIQADLGSKNARITLFLFCSNKLFLCSFIWWQRFMFPWMTCVVAQPKGTKVLDWVPQFTCILGQEYPKIEGPKDGEAISIGDRWKFFFLSDFLSRIPTFPENVTVWLVPPYEIQIGFLSPLELILLTSLMFLTPQFFQPPTLYPSVFIYRLPLVGLSWWECGFPLSYILD